MFGVVHRPTFEAHLRAHFQQGPTSDADDPAWCALRNVVYAFGWRNLLAKERSISFTDAQAQAWRYFEKALDVHTEILLNPVGLQAVQALTLMASDVLSPSEYALISLRLST